MNIEESFKAVEKFLEDNNIEHTDIEAEVYHEYDDSYMWFLWGSIGKAESCFVLCMKKTGKCEFRSSI